MPAVPPLRHSTAARAGGKVAASHGLPGPPGPAGQGGGGSEAAASQQPVQMLQVVPGPLPGLLPTWRYGHLS